MAKTLLCQCRVQGSIPGQGTRSYMLQLRPGAAKKKKKNPKEVFSPAETYSRLLLALRINKFYPVPPPSLDDQPAPIAFQPPVP